MYAKGINIHYYKDLKLMQENVLKPILYILKSKEDL